MANARRLQLTGAATGVRRERTGRRLVRQPQTAVSRRPLGIEKAAISGLKATPAKAKTPAAIGRAIALYPAVSGSSLLVAVNALLLQRLRLPRPETPGATTARGSRPLAPAGNR